MNGKTEKTMRANIEKTHKIAENLTQNRVAMEMQMNLAKMCFCGSLEMPQETPKASRERPGSTPEHAGNVPGASPECPQRIPGALRDLLERSNGAPERLGGDLGLIWYAKLRP